MVRLLFLLAILSASDVMADPLRIVMRSKDSFVVEYRCMNSQDRLQLNVPVQRTIVRQQGYVMWYVVGGVPPYTIVESEGRSTGQVCVTVVDAMGQIATATGAYNTIVDREVLECPLPESAQTIGSADSDRDVRRVDRFKADDGRYRSPATPRPRDTSTIRSKPGPPTSGNGPVVTDRGNSTKEPTTTGGTVVPQRMSAR